MLAVGLRHRLAAHKITAHRVGDGQRVAAPAITVMNQPLKSAHQTALGASAARNGEEKGGHRLRGRRDRVSPSCAATRRSCSWPARRLRQAVDELRRSLAPAQMRMALSPAGRAAATTPPHAPPMADGARLDPANPRRPGPHSAPAFVAGLPADPELGANLRHHCLVLARRNHKSHSLVHRAGLSPRHRRGPPRRAMSFVNDLSAPSRQGSYRIEQPHPVSRRAMGAGTFLAGSGTTPNQTVSRLALQ